MAFVSLYTLAQLILASAAIIYIYFKWSFTYWKRKGVPYLEAKFPLGNIESPFRRKQNIGVLLKSYYKHFTSINCKYGGIYTLISPIFIPVDPQIIRLIMAKDFQHFTNRGIYCNENDLLSNNLFTLPSPKWRQIRTKLTPTFTSGNLKMMFKTTLDCTNPLKQKMMRYCKQQLPTNVQEVLSGFTIEVIGCCSFGLKLGSSEQLEFRKYGRKSIALPPLKFAKLIFSFVFPVFSKKIGVKVFEDDVTDFYIRIVREAIEYREVNNVRRNDFLQLLMDIKNGSACPNDTPFTLDDVTAEAFAFFVAGYDTSSSLMSFCLYELSVNPEIQEKVREEIDNVTKEHNGELTYEAIQEMKYLEQVLDGEQNCTVCINILLYNFFEK